jgi:hypothetical protein
MGLGRDRRRRGRGAGGPKCYSVERFVVGGGEYEECVGYEVGKRMRL